MYRDPVGGISSAHAQFTLKWTSPTDSLEKGWTQTNKGGPLKYYTYNHDSRVWQIMNGPYSTTPQYIVTLPENPYYLVSGKTEFFAADVNGDGVFDFVIGYATSLNPYRYALEVIDPVSGSALLRLDDASYSYGDGMLEFVVPRWPVNTSRSSFLVYSTNAPATSVHDPSSQPVEFSLSQNYPNPFNLATKIEYTLESKAHAMLIIYDALGREVRRYDEGFREAGHYNVSWDARDNHGSITATGTYFYVLSLNGRIEPKKMILLK